MKILFWITSPSNSVGEITHARIFANQISSVENDIYFLINDTDIGYLKNSFKTLRFNDIQDISQYNFDMIIFSEYFQLGLKGVNSEFYNKFQDIIYQYIIPSKIPLSTFDTLNIGYEFLDFKEKIKDTSGWEKIMKRSFSDWERIMKLLNVDINVILPCPPNDPNIIQDFSNKKYYYWKIPECKTNTEFKENFKKKLGCSSQTKIIFMVISIWEYDSFKKSKKIGYFLLLEKILIHYLQKLDKDICLVIISPIPFHKSGEFNKVKLHHIYIDKLNKISYEEFENIFTSCDLILTNNTIQSTFMRAVHSGIPGIDIKSSIPIIENIDGYDVKPKFPLSEFTKEAIVILELTQKYTVDSINTSFKKNGFPFKNKSFFSQLFESVEIFDEKNFINLVYNLLYDKKVRNEFEELYKRYINSLEKCSVPINIIHNILKSR